MKAHTKSTTRTVVELAEASSKPVSLVIGKWIYDERWTV